MLRIEQIETGYGKKQVLFGLSLEVHQHETVAIIGPNGAGKSTILKTACGLLRPWKGHIFFEDKQINGLASAQNVGSGITFAPQGNRVFSELSVMENLEVGGCLIPRKELPARIKEVTEVFPILQKRSKQLAGKLSGGEQQMLTLARALVPKPKLLMLDEPSLGLSPNLVKDTFAKIRQIGQDTGVSILIVEQKVREVLQICDRVYSIKLGKVVFEGQADELKDNNIKLKELFL